MTLLNDLNNQKEETRKNRKEALEALVKRYGGVRALAIKLSRPPEQIYALLAGRRNIGDTLARSIETKLTLDEGFLDVPIDMFPSYQERRKALCKFTQLPVLSCVQAGLPTDHGDVSYDEMIEVPGELPNGCYALRVTGDSMAPLITEGDVVVINPSRRPKLGDCIVARSALENLSEATIKMYYPVGFDETGREVFEARPFNGAYPTMHSTLQKLEIVGTVCKLIKDL